MSTFKILAVISVEGDNIKKEKDAINELQVMIDDYADNNSSSENEISISIKTITKE